MSSPEPRPRHRLLICTTCRRPGSAADVRRDGAALFALVQARLEAGSIPEDVDVVGIECMSGCNRACTIALSGRGKPTYFFGDLSPLAETAEDALELAKLYRDQAEGNLVRGARPASFRRGILARIPAAGDET